MVMMDSVQSIARDFFSILAGRFPVCCSSDEFVFFPQALPESGNKREWDNLTPGAVQDTAGEFRVLKNRIAGLDEREGDPAERSRENASLLLWVMEVLEEQLLTVGHQLSQPTFLLTLVSVGFVQALETPDPDVLKERVRTLPAFLDRCQAHMAPLPDLYREMGREMVSEFSRWILSLQRMIEPGEILDALNSFDQALESAPSSGDFRLEGSILERVVGHHTGSGMDVRSCLKELEDEIREAEQVLESESARLGFGRDWKAAFFSIPEETIPNGDKRAVLLTEITRLKDHCQRVGFPSWETPGKQSLAVEPLPESLKTIRAADSYSAKPGFPFQGGVFYIFGGGGIGGTGGTIHPAYRLTVAHEAYPGHHLLDMCRWNGPDPVRRPVEYPLFYEGWACFGEDLMLKTGAFEGDYDRLILSRRRYRHAVRGRVDLLLHRGDLDLQGAARKLYEVGFPRKRALATARKYALRPGYQMCYTIGRRRFQGLFDSHGGVGIGSFARTVLSGGEILFQDLERVFQKGKEEGKRKKEEQGGGNNGST